jgi:glycine oxidase
MIAPALESLPEDVTADRAALLKRARDVWPAFAEAHGLTLLREGADWRGPDPEAAVARLLALGFEARLTPTVA